MITLENVHFGYRRSASVFNGLNLELQEGHIYGLLGKNGAGKSTLLKLISGLAFAQAGKCRLNGTDLSQRSVSSLQQMFLLPEDVAVPALSPREHARRTGPFYPKFSWEDFHRGLDVLDADPDLNMQTQSYGHQKKCLIAFGLACNTGVLLLDEPGNGLDIPSKSQFRKLIASGLGENRCMVISTHQVRDLESLIDSVIILHQGKVIVDAPEDKIAAAFKFKLLDSLHQSGEHILYQEQNARGYQAILKNEGDQAGRIDLELFFNGVIKGLDTRAVLKSKTP